MREFAMILLLSMAVLATMGAGSASPLGAKLPSVSGNALDGRKVRFPEDLAGKPAVLLVAYRRGTQADIDRWMAFLKANHSGVAFFEVPAIAGALWGAMSGWIDNGMRGGVPKENWPRVVTLYDDAPILKGFLGDHGGYNAHVTVLDAQGKVAWFYAGGFSDGAAAPFSETLRHLGSALQGGAVSDSR